jgi:Pyruvate/2-oxoacid:ferredoxin oxidoreductase delta subunit
MNEMRELAKNLVNAKDNNGDTALNILNKKNSSHPRCQEIKKMCEDAAVLLNQRERIKKLADEFHKGADDCAQASVEELNARQYFVMRDNADLTLTEWYVAMTSQRDGQDALSKARAYECGVCPIYAERLENCIDNLEFIQKELGAGSLTLQEFQSNEELANKLRDFENQRKSKKETLELIKEQQ